MIITARHFGALILQDLFFQYSLNNFLHTQVEHCVHHVFSWEAHPNRLACPTESSADTTGLGSTPTSVPTSPPGVPSEENDRDVPSVPSTTVCDAPTEPNRDDRDVATAQALNETDIVEECPNESVPEPTEKETQPYENPLLVHVSSH